MDWGRVGGAPESRFQIMATVKAGKGSYAGPVGFRTDGASHTNPAQQLWACSQCSGWRSHHISVCQSTFGCGAEVQGNRSHPKHGGIYGSEYGVKCKRSPGSPVCPSAPLDVRVTCNGVHHHLHCGKPAEVILIFDLVWPSLFPLLLPMKVLMAGSF